MFSRLVLLPCLVIPPLCFAASHEEILQLNAAQKVGSKVVCHVPWNIIVDQKPVTLDIRHNMTVLSNQGNKRAFQVITTFVPSGTTTPVITQRYRLNVMTDDTGEKHKVDPDSISVTSPYSIEMAQQNELQLRNTPESYQSDSMVMVAKFPDFTVQEYADGPVTLCTIVSENNNE
ncbi:hypothetical protein STS98_003596 [Cronobacter sakazakii]|nr:hypothetical protein [Cronobacter sakazakii]ELZ1648172.1 hypothetical protein [Cronobacter sakazakii]